eukprot:scaffold17604_cov53-Phaeocystis_antarctica.AAC.4
MRACGQWSTSRKREAGGGSRPEAARSAGERPDSEAMCVCGRRQAGQARPGGHTPRDLTRGFQTGAACLNGRRLE